MFAKKNTSDYDHSNHIGGVMVSALASSVGDRGFEPRSGKTNKCNQVVFLLYARSIKEKEQCWLARNLDNVSE